MPDVFLIKVSVTNPAEAMRNALRAALQHNNTYASDVSVTSRDAFRYDWAKRIRGAARKYGCPMSDAEHCRVIAQIAQSLSSDYGTILAGERLRFGTSQKAFNLYLKFLWRLGRIPAPPHCPVDGVILRLARIAGSWTQSDSEAEYMRWIATLREHAGRGLAEWEYEQWNRNG